MTSISISNLNTNGSDLFFDSESYLYALVEDDMIHGGTVVRPTNSKTCNPTVVRPIIPDPDYPIRLTRPIIYP